MIRQLCAATLALSLAGCSPGGGDQPAANVAETANAAAATEKAKLPSCPFRETSGWKGSVEGGRLLVTGTVDVLMAGFKPQLTPRSTEGGVASFELALVPEAGAAVTDAVRYERAGSPRYSAGEIWCGGERIATFDMINL